MAYRQIDKSTVDAQMSAAIRKRHFFTWWRRYGDDEANWPDLYPIVNAVRCDCDLPEYSFAKFEEGWQYRVCGHENYKIARDEMFNLCFGWW